MGNDRYLTYVRLAPGVTPESLKPAIRDMFERHVDMEELKKAGIELEYGMKPLLEMHAKDENVGNLVKMLAILAFALLFTAVMNYILISISSIVNRAKEVAVRKSYGASERNIHSIVVSETLVHMFLALLLAVFLVFLGRDLIRQLLDVSAGTLLFSEGALLLLIICVTLRTLSHKQPHNHIHDHVLDTRTGIQTRRRSLARNERRTHRLCHALRSTA